jgi:hypothetical protein
MMTAGTPEVLAVKTCGDEAGQPYYGKVHANVLGDVMAKDICDNNNEQDAGNITEYKKPE